MPRVLLLALALIIGAAPALAAETEAGKDANRFLRFKPIIVTLIQDDRPSGLVSVTVTLKLADPSQKDAIDAIRPRYLDAFTQTIMTLGQSHIDPRRPLDIPLLSSELQKAADRAAGGRKARVLIVDANTLAY